MQINPMICGSSFKNKGVQTLLNAVCAYLPSPADAEAIEGTDPRDPDTVVVRKPLFEEPLTALAFKIATDPYVGRLCFFRVYSGSLLAGSYVYNTRSGKKERISRLFQMHSNKQNPMEAIGCGDIGAGVGFKDIRTGDTLCDEAHPITLESMEFPDPVIGIAVEPKTQKDLDKLGMGLAKLAEEDPTFRVQTNEETGQTVISGSFTWISSLIVCVVNSRLNVIRVNLRLLIKKLSLNLLNFAKFIRNSLVVVVSLLISSFVSNRLLPTSKEHFSL